MSFKKTCTEGINLRSSHCQCLTYTARPEDARHLPVACREAGASILE